MSVTLGTLKTKIGLMLGDPNKSVYTDAKVQAAINLAIDVVQDYFEQWGGKAIVSNTTVAVVSGTELYNLLSSSPENVKQIEKVAVTLSDGTLSQLRPINFVDIEKYDTIPSDNEQHPKFFYRLGNQIGFKPTPVRSSTINLYYTAFEGDMTVNATAITMPPWVRNAILFRAAAYAAGWNGDMKAKRGFLEDYAEIKNELEYKLETWQKQDPPQVQFADIWMSYLTFVE